jgi:hypothetical protein
MLTQQVIQGDCRAVLPTVPSASVDFILTDPPYLAQYKDRYGRTLANDDDPAAVVGAYSELQGEGALCLGENLRIGLGVTLLVLRPPKSRFQLSDPHGPRKAAAVPCPTERSTT